MSKIVGNLAGCYSPMGKTFILQDENGVELATGVVTDQEKVFTATDNDVRENLVYASDGGVSVGTKNIPAYRTEQGVTGIPSGSDFVITLPEYNQYDYTKLQCIISLFNISVDESVVSDKVVINDKVFQTNSDTVLSNITKDANSKSIKLNINNDTDNMYVIRYFTYREEL